MKINSNSKHSARNLNAPQDEEQDDNAKIFPQRLMEVLSEESNHDCINWLPHGRAFIIVNRLKFANTVLPKYFKKTKWTSFTRKLNRWNFTRVNKGPELGAYYHEFFQRNNEALCTQMYCKNDRAKYAVAREVSLKQHQAMINGKPTMQNTPGMNPMFSPTNFGSALPQQRIINQNTPQTVHQHNIHQSVPPNTNNIFKQEMAANQALCAQTMALIAASKKGGAPSSDNKVQPGAPLQDPRTKAIMDSAYLALKQNAAMEMLKKSAAAGNQNGLNNGGFKPDLQTQQMLLQQMQQRFCMPEQSPKPKSNPNGHRASAA